MKKLFSMLLALCVVFVVFVACSTAIGEGEPSGEASAAKNENTIYIGVSQPLTGNDSEGGYQELLGIRYANHVCPSVEIGEETYAIKLLETDNCSDPVSAAAEAQRLVNSGATAVLGCYGSDEALSAAEIYNGCGIPVIGVSCTNPQITLGGPSSFRVCYTDDFQGSAMANFAYCKGLRKAAVLTQDGDAYSESLGEVFTKEFMRLGGEVFAYSFQPGQNNFETIAARIETTDADMIYLPTTIGTTANVIKQLRRNGLLFPVMGGDSYDYPSLINSCSIYGKNVYFCSGFDENASSGSISAEFVAKFAAWLKNDNERYKQNGETDYVSPVSALGYDAYMILVNAMKTAETLKPEDLTLAISQTVYDGVTGEIAFDANGDLIEKLAYIKTINTIKECFEVLQTTSVGK